MTLPAGRAAGSRYVFPIPVRRRRPDRIMALDGLTEIQRRAYEFVVLNPGSTIQETAVHLQTGHSTASYHLTALTRLGLVEAVRAGRQLRHFPRPRGFSPASFVEVLLRDTKRSALVHFLATQPVAYLSLNGIAKQTHLPFGFVKRTLEQMEAAGLVALERRHYRYHVTISDQLRGLVERD